MTVVIPTLAADSALTDCLRSLQEQSRQDFEVIVVDNSGSGSSRKLLPLGSGARVIENSANVGFGAAINQGIQSSGAAYVAALNDDAIPHPGWIAALLKIVEADPNVGMCASQVRLHGTVVLDSAGMLMCLDASSVQRGHGDPPDLYAMSDEALLPSGSAALYRREMLEHIGGFDPDFFLYCEDTDLGLRARWAGWRCVYVADAVVEHRYSHSAGRVSALKAYYVERNRLYVALKNFPLRMVAMAPFVTVARYWWHLKFLLEGRGKAAAFAQGDSGAKLVWFVLRAHLAAAIALPRLLLKRRAVRASAKISTREFNQLLSRFRISSKQVAAH